VMVSNLDQIHALLTQRIGPTLILENFNKFLNIVSFMHPI